MPDSLTAKQTEQLDAVDNAIIDLLNQLSPVTLEYASQLDAEQLGIVRDAVIEVLCENLNVVTEMELYPYIVEDRVLAVSKLRWKGPGWYEVTTNQRYQQIKFAIVRICGLHVPSSYVTNAGHTGVTVTKYESEPDEAEIIRLVSSYEYFVMPE